MILIFIHRSDPQTVPVSVLTVRFTACNAGRLVWRKPYGGVEISYHSEVPPGTLGSYHVCLTTRDRGIKIFTRSDNTLKRLNKAFGRQTKTELCVSSNTKEILVYFESLNTTRTGSAVVHYRTWFTRRGHGKLRHKDCKQCGYDELVRSFCTADFGKASTLIYCKELIFWCIMVILAYAI